MGKEHDVVRSHRSMGGTAWRYGLRVEDNRGPNNVLEWVRQQQLMGLNFDLGRGQMDVLTSGWGPIWAQMWLEGFEGKLYRIGRSMVYTPENLAGMLHARYKLIISGNGKLPQIEVHEPGRIEAWPRFVKVTPAPEDLGLLRAQMEGAGISFPM